MEQHRAFSEDHGRLAAARVDFVSSLGRRVAGLRTALFAVQGDPESFSRRNNLTRRLHATGSAARVLGFSGMAEALGRAERAMVDPPGERPSGLGEVFKTLDLLPSLIESATGAAGSERPVAASCVVVFGSETLASTLAAPEAEMDLGQALEPARAQQLVRVLGPDVVLIDADLPEAAELLEGLQADPMVMPVPILVVGRFERPDDAASWLAAGAARALPKPASPELLRTAVRELIRGSSEPPARHEPLGDTTLELLADRIAAEVRRGIVAAADPAARKATVSLGTGAEVFAAVWGTVARVREIVTLQSRGRVRFKLDGPEGAVPLAPWLGVGRAAGERVSGSRPGSQGVRLDRRRAVVADDDPAVVWFLGGILRSSGMEVLEAHDGQRALELARAASPDLVIGDALMPKLDGFSLCREIKRDLALRDVPVILLSWKEDLLQRLRELGAEANGFLRKEATADAVLERVREVLVPRARIEGRLESDGEVRGRLDGLTPCFLLQLAAQRVGDAKLSVRDAVFLYEAELREGRLVAVDRTSADGASTIGDPALRSLLGVSAGRFAIQPSTSVCRRDFDGALEQVLEEPLARARAAERALRAERLAAVAALSLDPQIIAPYLAATPAGASEILQELLAGAAPATLLSRGDAATGRLLEAVALDLARHGAVLEARDAAGADLLEVCARELVPTRPLSVAAAAAAVAPLAGKADAPSIVEAPSPPSAAGSSDAALFSFALSPLPPEAALPDAPATIVSQSAAQASAAPEAPDALPFSAIPTPVGSMSAPRSPQPTDHLTLAGVGRLASVAPKLALSDEPASVAAPGAPDMVPVAALDSALDESPVELLDAVVGSLLATTEPPAVRQTAAPAIAAGSDVLVNAAPQDLETAPPRTPEPSGHEPSSQSAAGEEPSSDAPASEPASSEPASTEAAGDVAPPLDEFADALADALRALEQQAAAPLPDPVADPVAAISSEPAPDEPASVQRGPDLGAPPVDADPPRASAIDAAATDVVAPADAGTEPAQDPGASDDEASQSGETPRPATAKPRSENKGSVVRTALLSVAAAALSYGAVQLLVRPDAPAAQAPEQAAVPAAAPSPPAGKPPAGKPTDPTKPAQQGPLTVRSDTLDLPPGIVLAPGKGLLEIDTGDRGAIYVDDTFVGLGPMRRVPIEPGKHALRVRIDGTEHTHAAEVSAGRRLRVSLRPAGK